MSNREIGGIKACVFDAYGTLFDVHSAAAKVADALGDHRQGLTQERRLTFEVFEV